jgi:chorismate synthase
MASNSFGEILKLTTFGESHGPSIGGVLDGFPAGHPIDLDFVQHQLSRRRPGQSSLTTSRQEDDQVQFLSGIYQGRSTGAPIAFTIANKDARSEDYQHLENVYRPGHADEVYDKKYGIRDPRGGGRSSARETAIRVVAGALCLSLLQKYDIQLYAYVKSIGTILLQQEPTSIMPSLIDSNPVRCPDPMIALEMIATIEKAKENNDSLGGQITAVVNGLPLGMGEPIYQKLNARLAFAMMSINAVQGFEMHRGFERTAWLGSQNNRFQTGISAGLSTGEPLLFNVAFKPTSTIAQAQSAKMKSGETTTLEATGRHDPCVLPRAVPIVEAMTALVLTDVWMMQKSQMI